MHVTDFEKNTNWFNDFKKMNISSAILKITNTKKSKLYQFHGVIDCNQNMKKVGCHKNLPLLKVLSRDMQYTSSPSFSFNCYDFDKYTTE